MKFGNWQKGALYGFIFVLVLSLIYTAILIFHDYYLSTKGIDHMCFSFTENTKCSFSEAVVSRIKFMFMLIISFGGVAFLFGGIIGYITNKIKISE